MKNKILFLTLFLCGYLLKAQNLEATVNVVDQNCNLGEISVNASGGQGNYVYAIVLPDEVPLASSFSLTNVFNVSSGGYDVYVRDNNGNVGYTELKKRVTVNMVPTLSFWTTVNQPICSGETGGFTIEASGGSGNYEYNVQDYSTGTTVQSFSNNNFLSNLNAGSYNVSVRDSDGCMVTEVVAISAPSLVSFNLTKDDNSCDTTTGGSITVVPSGGTGSYNYTLINPVSGLDIITETGTGLFTFTNLDAGAYEVAVSDSNGCMATGQSIVLLPELDFVVTETKSLDCSLNPNAEINIGVISGSEAYEYRVLNSLGGVVVAQRVITGNNATFELSMADTYTVEVFDTGATPNCLKAVDVEVFPVIEPSFSLEVSENNICNGSETGEIRIIENNNSINPLTYAISVVSGGPYVGYLNTNTLTYSNVPAGVYTIAATGTNGCTNTRNVTVGENTAIDISGAVTITEFGCVNGNNTDNAVITIDSASIVGGTGTYVSYEFEYTPLSGLRESQVSSNPVFSTSNESGGTVSITVYDNNNCSATVNVSITPFNAMTAPFVVIDKNIDCAAGEDISINFSSVSPLPNVEYSVTGINGTVFPKVTQTTLLSNPEQFTGLGAGSYEIEVFNPLNGCRLTTTHEVVEPVFSLDIDKTSDVSCVGSSTGAFSFNFSTLSPYTNTYHYEVFDSTTSVSTGITGTGVTGVTNVSSLFAGSYYVLVTQTGTPFCTITSPIITINEPTQVLDLTTEVVPISCNGLNDGSISINGVHGWGSYEYELEGLSGGLLISYSSDNVFANLAADTYTIRVRDTEGCVVTDQITIEEPLALSSAASLTQNYSCSAKGEITFVPAIGGVPPYEYGVNEVYSQDLIKGNLTEGIYSLTVRDANGCVTHVSTITIDSLAEIPELSNEVSYNCDGTGNVTVHPVNPNFTYQLNGGTLQTSNTFSVIPVGDHVITVHTTPECSKDIAFSVLENRRFSAEIVNSSDVKCMIGSDGEITLNVENYNTTFQYSIDSGSTWVTAAETPLTISGLSVGNYNVQVRSSDISLASCVVDLGDVIINQPPLLEVFPTWSMQATCELGAMVEVIATGGVPTYLYSMDGTTWQISSTFVDVAPGSHDFYVKDSNDCIGIGTIQIDSPQQIEYNVIPTACFDGSNGELSVTVIDGNGDYEFYLNGSTLGSPSQGNPNTYTFRDLAPGTYAIHVKDGFGCSSVTTSYTIFPKLEFVTEITNSTGVNDGQIVINASGGTPPYSYSIDGGGTYINSNVFSGLAEESYAVVVKDSNHCTNMRTATVASQNIDTDGDGVLDVQDLDDDNDGILDDQEHRGELHKDTDADGVPDHLDLDSDGDGVFDIEESGQDVALVDVDKNGRLDSTVDNDNDGVMESADANDNNAESGGNTVSFDTDGDGISDFQDLDSDNDGISDFIEGGGTPGLDINSDGVIDDQTDTDGDGLADSVDPDNGGSLLNTPDTDGDGIPNYLDLDSDGDGLNDVDEAGGVDANGDGQIDTDYLINSTWDVLNPNNPNLPGDLDTNNDGVIDDQADSDGDGIADSVDGLWGFGDQNTNAPDTLDDVAQVNQNEAIVINILENDSNIPVLGTLVLTTPSNGIVSINNNGTVEDLRDDAIYYTPNTGFVGEDTFQYEICDTNSSICSNAMVTITVISVNATYANNDMFEGYSNSIISGNVLLNDEDPEGDVQTVKVTPVTDVSNGTLLLNTDGVFEYTPNADFIGQDSFTYELCDSGVPEACDMATVTITVNAVNITHANNDEFSGYSNSIISGNVSLNDEDPEGDAQTVNITPVVDVSNGTLLLNADGAFEYTPNTDFIGQDTFTYELCDSGTPEACDTATVTIIIHEVSDPLSASIEVESIQCSGGCGEIRVTASGGLDSYSYELENTLGTVLGNNTTGIFAICNSGSYLVTVSDGVSTYKTQVVDIEEPLPVIINSVVLTSSGNEPSGTIEVNATGGSGGYEFKLDNGTYSTSSRFVDLPEGTYIIVARDSNNCTSIEFSVTLNSVDIDNSIIRSSNVLEVGYKDAIEYQWINFDTGDRISGATSSTYEPTEDGQYHVEMIVASERTIVTKYDATKVYTTEKVYSPIIDFKLETLGVDDLEKEVFKVYPNPVEEYLKIPSKLYNKEYKIYSLLGKEVDNGVLKNKELVMSQLSSGVYFLKVENYKVAKFVKK
ncbi:Ig-like domain-containing protein [Tenacibaculum xiamenense]|uniref:Ig-like domain-containing protein n=1 Tax=Tenacibaculum xiamenense TaxID=1261553 RepID=UPI0038930C52